MIRNQKPGSWGPGLDAEYHPSSGSENTYYTGALNGFWETPIGPESWELNLTQKGSFQITSYNQSSNQRKDFIMSYSADVAKIWAGMFETRLQFIGNFNFSTDKVRYQYSKGQVNFLLTAFF